MNQTAKKMVSLSWKLSSEKFQNCSLMFYFKEHNSRNSSKSNRYQYRANNNNNNYNRQSNNYNNYNNHHNYNHQQQPHHHATQQQYYPNQQGYVDPSYYTNKMPVYFAASTPHMVHQFTANPTIIADALQHTYPTQAEYKGDFNLDEAAFYIAKQWNNMKINDVPNNQNRNV